MLEWRIGGVEELICRLPHSPTLNSPTILSVFRTMTPRRGMRLAGWEYYTTVPPLQTEGNVWRNRALSSLKSLEWIDGLDAAVHLPIVQVFGENLVAAGRFRRRKHEGVIELDSVKTLDFKCALRQPKGAVHHA